MKGSCEVMLGSFRESEYVPGIWKRASRSSRTMLASIKCDCISQRQVLVREEYGDTHGHPHQRHRRKLMVLPSACLQRVSACYPTQVDHMHLQHQRASLQTSTGASGLPDPAPLPPP